MDSFAENCVLAVTNAHHHAVFLMDEHGVITSWNRGAENIFGYSADEIVGCLTSILYTEEDVRAGQYAHEMDAALSAGYAEDDRWHLRKDRTRFWSSGIMTPVYDEAGQFKGYLKVARDKTSDKLANERALFLARHDSLTSLPNRSMFHEQLSVALSEAKVNQSIVQVLLVDLDRFKEINDSYGHHVGDLFLKKVAKRLTDSVRASDLVARLGGDEFGIICRTADGETDSEKLAEKLVDKLSVPYVIEGKEIQSGASVGVTMFPLDSKDADQMLKNADLAMYAAKSSGRSAYRLYTEELDADSNRRRRIGQWLEAALEENSLRLHYQPQYALKGGEVTCVEALLRWQQCPISDVSSEELVTIATEVGLAGKLGEWTLRTACYQARDWRAQGKSDFRIAVNLSSGQLNATDFLKLVDRLLVETGLPAGCLDLEITEFMLMENNQANDLLFKSLKKKGVFLSVDDFGTGFSSLSALKTLPVDVLKIDREFISELPGNEHDAAIVSSIVGLAHSLKLKVAAEGIESKEQLEFLTGLGCDYGQGFLLRAPVPPEDVW